LGNEFFGKEGVKPREEKPVEKPSGEKPSDYCGRDGNKDEFFFKRKCEERMAMEWVNKDKYHPFQWCT
jgi:hypothetical protein